MFRRWVLLTVLILFVSTLVEAKNLGRKVRLQWFNIEGVEFYDLEIRLGGSIYSKKRVKTNQYETVLPDGEYSYRVRGGLSKDELGPWSSEIEFAVNTRAPDLNLPKSKMIFRDYIKAPIEFSWSAPNAGSRSFIQIKDKKNTSIVDSSLAQNNYFWIPNRPGLYKWRAGYENQGKPTWSRYRYFLVKKSALVSSDLIREEARNLAAAVSENKIDIGTQSGIWTIVRAAQSIVNFDSQDFDRGGNLTGSALAPFFNFEVRGRMRRLPVEPYTLSGSLNVELLNQRVSDRDFALPRAYGRLFLTFGRKRLRVGPIVHLQYGQSKVFSITSNAIEEEATVTRASVGAGGVAVYGLSDSIYLSALGIARMDLGGNTGFTGDLKDSVGSEFGFGAVFSFSEMFFAEARARYIQESYTWTATTDNSQTNYFTNTFLVFDLGIGIQLY